MLHYLAPAGLRERLAGYSSHLFQIGYSESWQAVIPPALVPSLEFVDLFVLLVGYGNLDMFDSQSHAYMHVSMVYKSFASPDTFAPHIAPDESSSPGSSWPLRPPGKARRYIGDALAGDFAIIRI